MDNLESLVMRLTHSIKVHQFRVAEVNKTINFIDTQIKNPQPVEGLSEEEVVVKLQDARKDCENILQILNEGATEIKKKCEDAGYGALFEVSTVMSSII